MRRGVLWVCVAGLVGCSAFEDPELLPPLTTDAGERAGTRIAVADHRQSPPVPPGPPASLVQGCVDYVLFEAFVGNEGMQEIWTEVGESESGLRRFCVDLASEQPALVEGMRAHVDDVSPSLDTTAPPPP